MSKYRLSYLGYGGYKSVDLSKLECLNGRKVTDIQTIDGLTANFENLENFLEFLKRNKLIDDEIRKLVITVDKKANGITYFGKIFKGEELLFKKDVSYLNVAYIYKWIMKNKDNPDCIIEICENYIDKYKNAYNIITGSSYILPIFTTLKDLALNMKLNNRNLSINELREFDSCIDDFMTIEFYKIDKDVLTESKGKTLVRKKDKDGILLKSYRNIHDFVILMNSLERKLEGVTKVNISEEDLKKSLLNKINIQLESKKTEEDIPDIPEEFITEEDNVRNVKNMMNSIKETSNDNFEPFRDGNDFIAPMSLKDIESALYESGKKLCIKLGDGYLE